MKPTKSRSSSDNVRAPCYDMRHNPPYQINYRAKRAGKHISASKRRITFQFGFSSASAISAGRTEVDCRGEEHEVVLIWSHITGKRQLFMDGREVHMSKAARGNTKFEYSWQIPGNHVLKMLANGTPPMGENGMYRKQFDLELDGMSFFEFAKIYELGNSSGCGGSGRATEQEMPVAIGYSYLGMAYDARDDDDEEEDERPMPEVKVTFVDLFDTQPFDISPVSYNNIPSLVGSTSSNSTSSFDEFMPVEPPNQYQNQYQKSFASISNEILSGYSIQAPPAPSASSQQSSSRALVPVSEEGIDAITKSMRNIVNLDDITSKPLQPLSPNSRTLSGMKRDEAIKWGLVGRAPTLAEMRGSTSVQSPVMQPQPVQQQAYNQQGQPQAMSYQGQQGAYQYAAPSYGYQYGAPQPHQAPQYGYAPAY